MEFIIGSTNLAKVRAANEVIAIHFPEASISNFEVGSGVSNQPFGDEETRLGAYNRALRAGAMKKGAIGIGLEGGVKLLQEQMYLCNWGAMTLPDGTRFTAGGAQIPLPEEIAIELLEGKELGPVIENYFKMAGIRQSEGAIGMLTSNAVNRDELFAHVLHLLVGQLKFFRTSSNPHRLQL
jgi:inosine/xanthosine triphosphatase